MSDIELGGLGGTISGLLQGLPTGEAWYALMYAPVSSVNTPALAPGLGPSIWLCKTTSQTMALINHQSHPPTTTTGPQGAGCRP